MMKTFAGAGCVLLLAAAAVASDDPTRIYSQPPPPSREALDRLNLEMAWAVYVPMDSRRDGFASVQVSGNQLIIQTRSGMITVLDVENGGRALWRSRPGLPYQAALPPTFNPWAVITTDSVSAFALDRDTGSLQWKHTLSTTLTAPPVMDDTQIYACNVQQRTIAFRLPDVSTGVKSAPPAPAPGEEKKSGADNSPAQETTPSGAYTPANAYAEDVRALFAWDYQTNRRIEHRPVLSNDSIFIAIPGGGYLALPKRGSVAFGNAEIYRYSGDSPYSAPPGAADGVAYLGTEDAHLYAIGIDSGKSVWSAPYISGTPVTRAPVAVNVADGVVLDRDLYVTAEGKGLARLDRQTGLPVWSIRNRDYSPEADRVLAVNPKFVYATDRSGRLVVLDRKNGVQLSRYDVHDFVFPITNADTDRVYLASNDGLIVCLHDKDYTQPLSFQKTAPKGPPEKPLAERIQELKDKLANTISDPGEAAPIPFKTYQAKIAKLYGLKIFASAKAFKDLMLPPPADQMVTPPKVDNKPLGEALREVLGQIGADYTQVEDTIVIGPAAKPKGP